MSSDIPDVGPWVCVEHGRQNCPICFPSGSRGSQGGSGSDPTPGSITPIKITPGGFLISLGYLAGVIGILGMAGALTGSSFLGSFLALLAGLGFIFIGVQFKKPKNTSSIPATKEPSVTIQDIAPGLIGIIASLGMLAGGFYLTVFIFAVPYVVTIPLMIAGGFLLSASNMWTADLKQEAQRRQLAREGKFVPEPDSLALDKREGVRDIFGGLGGGSLCLSLFFFIPALASLWAILGVTLVLSGFGHGIPLVLGKNKRK